MTTRVFAAMVAALLACAPSMVQATAAHAAPATGVPTPAQDTGPLTDADIENIRQGLRADKRQSTAEALALTPAEATKFWPIYDRYIIDLTRINNAKYGLIQEYSEKFGTYTDRQASDFIRRWLDVDIKADQLRSRYVPIVGKILPGLKMASFFQIDRRLAMLVNVGLSSQLPVLQSQTDK